MKSLAFCMLLFGAGITGAWASGPQAVTRSGTVEGKYLGSVSAYLGIPYAAPPLGELRWKAPEPAPKWRGVRKATELAAHCMQSPVFPGPSFKDRGASEDCLVLNIWAPAEASRTKRPVMVWIHGGGFVNGAGALSESDGARLAEQGVIVVAINYRLGIFGFLVLPDLAAESRHGSAGNYGLRDQIAALRWVKDNIAAFGGDPQNVTVFGESAGSFCISMLMVSPEAKGLFQKAIGESGASFYEDTSGRLFTGGTQPFGISTLKAREKSDLQLVKKALGVSTLAELRRLPAQRLLDAFFRPGDPFQNLDFIPIVDGDVVPEPLPAIFAKAKQNDVSLLAGWNRDEGSLNMLVIPSKPDVARLRHVAESGFADQSDRFLSFYAGHDDAEAARALTEFEGDRFTAWSTWRWLEAQATTGTKPVFRYRFDHVPPSPPGLPPLGAAHAAEVRYVFGVFENGIPWSQADHRVSEIMQRYWINFARTGDPNGPGLPSWPEYSSARSWPVMHLTEEPVAQPDDSRDRYLFLSSVWAR